jgi:Holliday junction resolvase RusA-like endonuclease
MVDIQFTIPLPPVSKKNSNQILINKANNRPFIMPSERYRKYEKAAVKYVPKHDMICNPVNVKCVFYMQTRRAVDKANLEEAIHDVLVRAGLLEDDNRDIIASGDGTRVFYDKENPRTEVHITSAEEGYKQWSDDHGNKLRKTKPMPRV